MLRLLTRRRNGFDACVVRGPHAHARDYSLDDKQLKRPQLYLFTCAGLVYYYAPGVGCTPGRRLTWQ